MRTLVPIAALLALSLASCATTKIVDELPAGAPRGYVCVYTAGLPDAPNVRLSRVVGGERQAELKNWDSWSSFGELRIACAPGRNDFDVVDQNYEESFSVDVEPGRVTYLSFRKQYLYGSGGGPGSSSGSISYYTRGSAGVHALPSDPGSSGPAPFVAALADEDWGTRRAALAALRGIKPSLSAAEAALVSRLAFEDPLETVRDEARALLKDLGLPLPAAAIFLETFQNNLVNHWYLSAGAEPGASYSFAPDGYSINAQDDNSHWSTIALEKKLGGAEDFDVVLECESSAGKDAPAFGLVLGSDSKDFHAFCVAGNGNAMAARFSGSVGKTYDIPWTKPDPAPMEVVKRIAVAARAGRFALSVNGVPIGSFEDSAMPIKVVGVIAWGSQRVVYRKLIFKAPE